MEITFEREQLLKPLAAVAGVVERRQTLPILSNVLVKAEGSKGVSFTGTDLEVEVIVRTTVKDAGQGAITVNARKLLDICRALPEGAELRIKQEGEKVVVRAGKSRFSLATLPAADFPSIEAAEWQETLTVGEGDLRQLLDQAHFCMAQQDVRYYLNGLLLDLGGKTAKAVATDGHRMALAILQLKEGIKADRQIIIPRKAVMELLRMLEARNEAVTVQIGMNHVRVKAEDVTFTAKLIDGRFPDYSKVIPSKQSKHLNVPRSEFREALSRVAILSNEKYRGVRLTLSDGVLRMSAHNPEQEEAQEELAVSYKGEPLEIGFNVSYLIDAVNAVGTTDAELGLNDPNSSCVIRPPDKDSPQYIVMPMRL